MSTSPRFRFSVCVLLGLAMLASRSAGQSFPASFDLSTLDGTNGFVLNGIDDEDNAGSTVTGVGDMNGDGLSDFVVGARLADPGGNDLAGECYVVFGSSSGFPASVDLASLNGATGFVLLGSSPLDFVGSTVSDAGDVNEDGLSDLVIGANNRAHVVYGSSSGYPASLNLNTLDGTNGFTVRGASGNILGLGVSGVGDVNADGVDDLLLGAPGLTAGGDSAGGAYVIFGSSSGFPAALPVSTLGSSDGFVINGLAEDDRLGWEVSDAGDMNADGISDILIAGRDFFGPSDLYVVFGSASSFGTSFDLATLDGTNGFAMTEIARGENAGESLAHAGDVNADGVSSSV